MLLLLLLFLASSDGGQAERVSGQKRDGSCVCAVNSSMWSFPAVKFNNVLEQVDSCEGSLKSLQDQLQLSDERLPRIQTLVMNLTGRLEPHKYLSDKGLYSDLSLHLLAQELSELEGNINDIHTQFNNTETKKLSKEVGKLRHDVDKLKLTDTTNLRTVKEKLRYLRNSAESCRTIPKDFIGQHRHCLKGLIRNISDPVTTKVSPNGKSYISGSWGKQAQMDSKGQKSSYWVQPLVSSHIYGNTLRVYQSYKDFIASVKHRDYTFAPSHSDSKTIEGPSAVLYGEALYYHCYRSADVCRYDLNSNAVIRVTLPGSGVGFNNRFPYCYYDCRLNSDVDLEADETGLWAIYATMGNHGNIVVSRLIWDEEANTINVTHTWETRLFKKAVSNAFMTCGVLYATRFVDDFHEEVFYAFDTSTGKEDNSLALPLQKVAKGVASLSYNPNDKQIYMYNDGYLLASQVYF